MGLVIERFPLTLKLGAVAIGISVLIAVPIGVLSAVKKDTIFDLNGKVFALLGQATPPFWLGIMLIWILRRGGRLVSHGRGRRHIVDCPAGHYAGLVPGCSPDEAGALRHAGGAGTEYVTLARVKGIQEWKVIWKHCLRNASIPPLDPVRHSGRPGDDRAIVTETVFSLPGTGNLAIEAIRGRDYPVIQAVVVLFAVIYIGMNLAVDILYAYLDPRIRYDRA